MKILLVDDNKGVADSTIGALETRGYEVVWAPFSQDADDALYEADFGGDPFDVAIVDWDLGVTSEHSGDVVTREIKERYPTMGICLWSGDTREHVEEADVQVVKGVGSIDEVLEWLEYEASLR